MKIRRLVAVLLATVLCTVSAPAVAQYKWVDPSGRVVYSDHPPPPGVAPAVLGRSGASRGSSDGVPAALRDTVGKFPVVLYTTPNCSPCQLARSHLTRRGIPFAERTVSNAADAEAFRAAGFGDNTFPSVSIGRERSAGFDGEDWDFLLDAAGYPRTSKLLPSYKPPPPQAAAGPPARRAAAEDDASGVLHAEAAAPEDSAPRDSRPRPARPSTRQDGDASTPRLRF